MKKFLSIFLTLCLMLTVVAVPLPAMAVVTSETVFDFENYTPDRWIAMSGRVDDIPEPGNEDNTVIKFDNNGIPYRTSDIDTSNSHTKKADGTFAKVSSPDAAAYSTYYHASAMKTDFVAKNGNTMEAYNAIELDKLEAATTYEITVNYKRISLVNDLYVQPVTWAPTASWRGTMYLYNDAKITINATENADNDYVSVSTTITTPSDLITEDKNTGYGPMLRLVLYTGQQVANNVVYFDNITVEKVALAEVADVTYNYADGTVVEETDVVVGTDLADLAANRLGENNGVWYTDAQGTTEAPATVPAGGLEVYEVVKTGVFDFNNYYNYADYNGNNSDFAVSNSTAFEVADGVLKYDSSKSTENTVSISGKGRINSIAIGEAKENTTYKITVYYKRGASENAIIFTPLTGMKSLTAAATKVFYDSVSLSATETADSEYQKAEIVVTTAETFAENAVYGGKSNCFYLNVATTTNGQTSNVATLDIDKITVEEYIEEEEEYVGSVTYVIPENATVGGQSGNITVDYYSEDTVAFPEVVYAEGYIFDAWKDADGNVVTTPTLGGTYTLFVKEGIVMATITLNRGGVTQMVQVEKGTEYTLPDTEFTDTSWWSNETADKKDRFVGYEGDKVVVNNNLEFYTTETYASSLVANGNKSIYGNWTRIETSTEDGSYLYKEVTNEASTTWAHNTSTRLCTRLGVVEDGNTYRISVTYKATTNVPLDFVMVISHVGNGGGAMRNYLENGKVFHTVSGNTDGWKTVTYYITADTPHEVTANNNGLDDTKVSRDYEALYLMVNKAEGADNVEIAIKETVVEDLGEVVVAKGASVLKDENVVNGKQAMRYYFDYKTETDGTTITVGGKEYTVKERGFLYTNGDIAHYAAEGVNGSSSSAVGRYFISDWVNNDYGFSESFLMWLAVAKDPSGKNLLTHRSVSGEALANNWAFDTDNGIVTFSTYVTGIKEESFNAKMMVRGYVIFEDENGVQHTIYSQTVNRSVQGVIDALAERHEQ